LFAADFVSYLILYEVFVEATLAQPTVLIDVLAPTVVAVEPNFQVSTKILKPTPVLAATDGKTFIKATTTKHKVAVNTSTTA
jgi:hypothetical protein